MDQSISDLEFFDFENSSDEEIKEIQAILKGHVNISGVELPWETSVKNKCPQSVQKIESSVCNSEPLKTSNISCEADPQPINFITQQTLQHPAAQLSPQNLENFATLASTVGPYQNAPFLVSRTLPYLRTYPPMGVPFFACPLPGTSDASPYGQFVPMAPELPPQIREPSPKNRNRQSNRKNNKRRTSETITSHGDDSPMSCPKSVPLVPLPVPPATFVSGNLPLHGFPPGMHSSPAMYYVPVFNHPYGGYLSPSGPPFMLPVNIPPADHKCSSQVTGEVSAKEASHKDSNKKERETKLGQSDITLQDSNRKDSPTVKDSNTFSQTSNSNKELLQEDEVFTEESPATKSFSVSSSSLNSEKTPQDVQLDCEPSTVETLPDGNHIAKSDVSKKDALPEPTSQELPKDCFQETKKCLKENVSLSEKAGPTIKRVSITDDEWKDNSLSSDKAANHSLRCWADLFKGEVNGLEVTPKVNYVRKSTPNKKNISNGKVPASNNLQ